LRESHPRVKPIRRKRGSPIPFPERHQFLIGVHNETLSVVAVRICNPDYRISVAADADRGLLKSTKSRSVNVLRFWFFAYSIH